LCVANTLLSLLLPLALFAPTAAYNASSLIAESIWTRIQRIFTVTNKAHIIVTGDALPPGESAIVVANHVEWTDFYMIQELAMRAGMLGRCRWFAKKELKWVPFLGWGLWAMGMPLVSRRWMEDRREMERVFGGVVQRKWPICRFSLCALSLLCSPPVLVTHPIRMFDAPRANRPGRPSVVSIAALPTLTHTYQTPLTPPTTLQLSSPTSYNTNTPSPSQG